MSRKRLIDIDNLLFDDELVEALGVGGLWVYPILWGIAEDWGGYEPKYGSIALRSGALRLTREMVEKAIQTLIDMGKILPYQVNGKTYHWIKNFLKHQNLNNPSPPLIPLPPWLKWVEAQYPSGKKYAKYSILQDMLPGNSTEITGSLPVAYREPTGSPRNETETETKLETKLDKPPIIPQTAPDPVLPAAPPADLDSKSSRSKPEAVPYQAIIDLWNTHAPELLPRASLTEKRKPKIKAAWKEYPSLDWWRELFIDIALSPWHSHLDRWQGNSFDWMLKNRTEMREKLNALKGNGQRESFCKEPVVIIEPDPPGIMIPLPDCPACGGSGLARDGPCECLQPENPDDPYWQEHPVKRLENGKAGKADHQGIAKQRPFDGPGSGAGRAGGHPPETGRAL